MEISRVLSERRTVHKYKDKVFDFHLIEEAIRLASFAPCHKLTYPQRFLWVTESYQQKIFDLALEQKQKTEVLSEVAINKLKEKMLNPNLLVVMQTLSESEFQRKEDYATCAMAIQNLKLYLWDKGLGTKWSTGKITRSPETYKLLKVNPEEHEIIGFVWVGKAAQVPRPAPRPALEHFLKKISE